MESATRYVLAAVTVTQVAASASFGDFLGIEAVHLEDICDGVRQDCGATCQSGWIDNGYIGLVTFRIYAVFDNAGDDGILAVFGAKGFPLSVQSSDGTFFNSVFGGNTAPPDLRPAGIWEQEWDSYITIGRSHQPDATMLSPGFATLTGDLAMNWATEESGWSVRPEAEQGRPDEGGCVQLAQFSVPYGESISGVLNLRLRNGSEVMQLGFSGSTCVADISGDDLVDVADVLLVLSAWGPCEECPQDIDGDGVVGFSDLLAVLQAWGPCP